MIKESLARNRSIATLGIRLLLGLLFFWQGHGKIFDIGLWGDEGLYNMFFIQYNEIWPEWLLKFTCGFTSYAELICGALVTLGLFRDYALYVLLLVLVIVTMGHGSLTPIWDTMYVEPRAFLLLALLLLPNKWDQYRLDSLLFKK